MAWDTTKISGDTISSADYNSSVTDQKTRGIPATESDRGSDCSGSDATTSRVLTLTNTSTTKSGGFQVFVNGLRLYSSEYSVSHLAANTTITFNNKVWDADYITTDYFM